MDLITQGLFGALVGQAAYRQGLGKRAVVIGLAAGLTPDMDFLIGTAFGDFAYWRHHRGFTHSFLFAPLLSPLFAWLCVVMERGIRSLRKKPPRSAEEGTLRFRQYWGLWFWVLITHPILDLFTAYGTQLLYPLTDFRFAVDAMSIVDPVYSLPILAVLIFGFIPRYGLWWRVMAARGLIFFLVVYTMMGWGLGDRTVRAAEQLLPADAGPVVAIHAYPTLLQPYWRRVVAYRSDGSALETHMSAVSLPEGPLDWKLWESVARTDPSVQTVMATWEGFVFDWFASGRVQWRVEPGSEPGTFAVEGHDIRYSADGMDGSFWGIGATVDAEGQLIGAPWKLHGGRPDGATDFFGLYWKGLFGTE